MSILSMQDWLIPFAKLWIALKKQLTSVSSKTFSTDRVYKGTPELLMMR
ncbi:MAG: hypothetical protein Q6353_018645 [Candidatus Sigynarchaeum springense]